MTKFWTKVALVALTTLLIPSLSAAATHASSVYARTGHTTRATMSAQADPMASMDMGQSSPTGADMKQMGEPHAKVSVIDSGGKHGSVVDAHDAGAGPNWPFVGLFLAAVASVALVTTWPRRHASSDKDIRPNLLAMRPFRRIMESRLYPGILQVPTLLVFSFIVFELLFGPASAHDNFGTAATWVLWWPLIPLLFLLLGRFWCAICPFALISDLVQKVFGSNKSVPKFLKRYGIWIIDATFILITWADHTLGIVENPRGSGTLLVFIVLGVATTGVLFERRTWCRHLCFLGGLSGNYARAGAIELRATPSKCAECGVQACYKGSAKAPGCPMFEFPRTMDTNASCNLCGYCVKNCPNDSIRISTRIPTSELWAVRKPKFEEAFLATVIMGIVFTQNITMLKVWKPILASIERVLGTTNYFVTFTAVFAVMMALPIALLVLASCLSGRSSGRGTLASFTVFGYALIPLDLAGHLAHNLFHLLAEGKSVVYTAMGLFGMIHHSATGVVDDLTIQVLQYTLVVLGTLGSVYTAYRMARGVQGSTRSANAALPIAALIVLLGVVNLALFYLPMEMRM